MRLPYPPAAGVARRESTWYGKLSARHSRELRNRQQCVIVLAEFGRSDSDFA